MDITIVMTTWFVDEQRLEIAQDVLNTWHKNFIYDDSIHLHIADDGSTLDWKCVGDTWSRGHITYSRQERQGVGASLNKGFKKAFETSPIIFYGVDDWYLEQPLDLTPWVYLLKQREDVGIVRLGPPHPHLKGTIMPITELWQGWGLVLDRYGLSVGHRPMLFHKRWIDFYGWHRENTNAQECERLMSVQYADEPDGPLIVYALYHPWYHHHLDVVPSTSHIDP